MSQQIDTLFTGGSVFRPGSGSRSGQRSRWPGAGSRPSGPMPSSRRWSGRTPTSWTSRVVCCFPASRTRTSTRCWAAWPCASASCTGRRPPRSASTSSRRTPLSTRSSSGSSVVAGRWSSSRAAPRRVRRSTRSSPTGRCYLTNRDGHGAWVNTAALELAGVDAGTPDPPDGRIERDADGNPTGTLHEGAVSLVGRLLPDTSDDDLYAGAAGRAQDLLLSLGITAWQDAAVGACSASTTSTRSTSRPPAGRPHGARGRRPVVGAGARCRADPRARRPARPRGGVGRFARHQRQDHAGRRGRELHRRDARARTSTRDGCATDNCGPELRRPGRAARARDRSSTRPASRSTSTRSATGPSARRSTPSRRRAPANGPTRRPAPPRPPAGRAPRRRPAVRASSARSRTSSRCGPPTSRRWTS